MSQFTSNVGWDDEIVITRRPTTTRMDKSAAAVNAAMRSGVGVLTEKKRTGLLASLLEHRIHRFRLLTLSRLETPINKAHTGDHRHAAKVDRETEDFHVEKVDLSVSRAIQKGRQDKGLTQKDLAVKVNEKQSVISDYESSKAIPNQQVLTKLERELGVKLRGKDIGLPLPARGSSAKK